MASAEGIDTLVSNSQQNVSTITLNLRLNANADRAMTDVLAKVAQVKYLLPREANDPVVVKQTGQGTALLYMSFNSDSAERGRRSPITSPAWSSRACRPSTASPAPQILGGQNFAMRVWLDPDRMAARGVTALDIRTALAGQQFHLRRRPDQGRLHADQHQRPDLARDRAGLRPPRGLQPRRRAGALGDVARIELGPESVDSSAVFDGLKAVFIGVYATPTANPLTRDHRRAQGLPRDPGARCRRGSRAAIAYDATEFIRASI